VRKVFHASLVLICWLPGLAAAGHILEHHGLCELAPGELTRQTTVSVALGCETHGCNASGQFEYHFDWVETPVTDAVARFTFDPFSRELQDQIKVTVAGNVIEGKWEGATLVLEKGQAAILRLPQDPAGSIVVTFAIDLSQSMVDSLIDTRGQNLGSLAAVKVMQRAKPHGYRSARLYWSSGYCPSSLRLKDSDRVTFDQQQTGEAAVAVVNSAEGVKCSQDRVAIAPSGQHEILLGDLTPGNGCPTQLLVATRSSRVQVMSNVELNPGTADVIRSNTAAPVKLDLAFWILSGDFKALASQALDELAIANEIFAREHAGIRFNATHLYDATQINSAELARIYCTKAPDFAKLVGSVSRQVNVYYVPQIEADLGCAIGADTIAVDSADKFVTTLAHELGHVLALTHSGDVSGMSTDNLMATGTNARGVLTLGQVQRVNLSECSVINRLQLRGADPVGQCPGTRCGTEPVTQDTLGCFRLQLDWRAGHIPALPPYIEPDAGKDLETYFDCVDCREDVLGRIAGKFHGGQPPDLRVLEETLNRGLTGVVRRERTLALEALHRRMAATNSPLNATAQEFVTRYVAARDRNVRRKAYLLLEAIARFSPQATDQSRAAQQVIDRARQSREPAVIKAVDR